MQAILQLQNDIKVLGQQELTESGIFRPIMANPELF